MKMKQIAAFLAGALCLNAMTVAMPQTNLLETDVASAADAIQVEGLDRGLTAINTGSGMLVSWRFLANDADNATFNLYRDGTLIYTSNSGDATCYLDAGGSASSSYRVDTVANGAVSASDSCSLISNNAYFDIGVSQPGSGYTPNDCSVGDVDGDGQYEIFLKWDPNNSQDNSKSGTTGNVYIDCLKLDGTRLWRIDLGRNIRAGAHYTQMMVGDFDSDGSAELICKTSDATVDGKGTVIGDANADYRNSKGYILTGNEFLTLFDGQTGAALDTINYNPGRGTVSKWGDSYGNRVDRFLSAVMYLDADHPSAVTVRGYYTRMTACAYDVVNKKLVQRWYFDTGNTSSNPGYGDGNHNCMPADVDGDGKQELVLGAVCLDDDGTVLWCNNKGHGDAMHLSDFLPDRNGQELWVCHEESPYGATLIDAANGSTIFHYDNSSDTGRCGAGNIWAGNDGGEFWAVNTVYNGAGTALSCRRPALNFLSYWDGDLEREILDGYTDSPATITKMNSGGTLDTILTTTGYYTCNTTKGTPCLSADLFGDWREELIVRAADSKSIRIYATPYDTDYRVTTLMHDPQYRNQVAGQNVAYNQPPHPSFYLGSDQALPARPNVTVNGATMTPIVLEGELFKQLTILDRSNGLAWALGTNPAVGSKVFGDRDFTFVSMPETLNGSEYVLTACDSKFFTSDLATFVAGDTMTVYVGVDSRMTTLPAWMSDWTATGESILLSNDVTMVLYQKGIEMGEMMTLGTNGTSSGVLNYIVFANTKPIVYDGTLVRDMTVHDRSNGADWGIDTTGLAANDLVFGDRDVTFASVPDVLLGAEQILTACDSKSSVGDAATFTAGADITVYIGLDARVTAVPAWMSDWTAVGQSAVGSNDVQFVLYSKNFSAGETVTLGENGQSAGCVNYIALVAEQNTAPAVLRGDVNLSGDVSVADAVLVQKHIIVSASLQVDQAGRADLNEDGIINVYDLALLKQILLN